MTVFFFISVKAWKVIFMEKQYWEGKNFSFFSHKQCEYYPCHEGADAEQFNCLFCYCPLYALGEKCGGNFRITEDGIKYTFVIPANTSATIILPGGTYENVTLEAGRYEIMN